MGDESGQILFNSRITRWDWLSNFSPHPVGRFKTAEAAYQASKTLDPEEIERIARAATPGEAKRRGALVSHRRPNWDEIKIHVMARVLDRKFEDWWLRVRLIETGRRPLIHLSPWDTFWGVDHNGHGRNHQGVLLEALRARLIRECRVTD